MSDKKHQKTITLTKLDDTSHYRLWRAATEATFDVYNVLNIVLGTEVKPTELSATDAEKHCSGCQKQGHDVKNCPRRCFSCWERGHLKADCLKRRWAEEQCLSKGDDEQDGNDKGNDRSTSGDREYRPSFERR